MSIENILEIIIEKQFDYGKWLFSGDEYITEIYFKAYSHARFMLVLGTQSYFLFENPQLQLTIAVSFITFITVLISVPEFDTPHLLVP